MLSSSHRYLGYPEIRIFFLLCIISHFQVLVEISMTRIAVAKTFDVHIFLEQIYIFYI